VIQAITGGLVKDTYANFVQIVGWKLPESFCYVDVYMGLLDKWTLKKNLLGGYVHNDLAFRTSFRGDSLLHFSICFLKMCVAMSALGCFFNVTLFSILYHL
jgi:hypothetical protein